MADPRITEEEVRHVARLAALELDEGAVQQLRGELDAILHAMRTLDALDVRDVEPTLYPVPMQAALRPDVPIQGPARSELLAAAPRSEAGAFAVPKVLDGEG